MLDSTFSAALEAASEQWKVPAVAVGVSVGGRRETLAFGCSADDRFRIASITKPFTATLALSVLEPSADARVWPGVTVEHLLSHTSGYAAEHGDVSRFPSLAELVPTLARIPRWVDPGVVWSYANTGYWLAGWLAAEAAGAPYEDALAARVLRPAGLDATAFEEPTLRGTGPDATDGEYPPARRPSGGLASTVDDLLAFGEWQLAEAWTAPLRRPLAKPVGGVYGLGFFGERVAGTDVWGHPGSYGGFQSSFLLVPSHDAVFVGLTNSSRGKQALRMVEDEFFERLLGARRRVPETVAVEAGAFVGLYANGEGEFAVSPDGGSRLRVVATYADGNTISSGARAIGERTFELEDGDVARDRFDFPLDGFGRFGGRLAERVG